MRLVLVLGLVLGASASGCFGGSREDDEQREAHEDSDHNNAEGLKRLRLGELDGAEEMFRRALAAAELLDDLERQAESWNNLGALEMARGAPQRALALHERAERLHARGDGEEKAAARARTAMNRGTALLGLGRHAEAAKAFAEAAAIAAEEGDDLGVARARVGTAAVALARNDKTAALATAREAERGARSAEDDETLAAALSNVAAAEIQHGRLPAAKAAIEEALELDRKRGAPAAIAGDLRALAHVQEKLGEAADARDSLARAARVAHQLGQLDAADRDFGRVARMARAAGATREALEAEDAQASVRAQRAEAARRKQLESAGRK